MKTAFTFLAALAVIGSVQGQTSTGANTSGVVQYEAKMKLDIKLDGDAAQFAGHFPKERTEKKILYFTPEASLYKVDPASVNKEAEEMEAGGAMIQIKTSSSDDQIYRDLKENKRIEQREFLTRMFLIQSDAGKSDWKLTGEQKTILNYHCQEAIREDDGDKIRAWFTPEIPVPTGPQSFGNLPGLILAVDIDNGDRTYTATSVELKPIDNSLLEKPRKGKKVTAEEYKKIVDEKLKENGATGTGGTHVIMRIQR